MSSHQKRQSFTAFYAGFKIDSHYSSVFVFLSTLKTSPSPLSVFYLSELPRMSLILYYCDKGKLLMSTFSAKKWIASIYPSAVVNFRLISISCCQLWVNIHQLLSTVVGIWRNLLRNHYKEFKGKYNRVEGLPNPSPWTQSPLWNPQPANRLSVSVPFFQNPDFDVAEELHFGILNWT